jgi:hypothetical protein
MARSHRSRYLSTSGIYHLLLFAAALLLTALLLDMIGPPATQAQDSDLLYSISGTIYGEDNRTVPGVTVSASNGGSATSGSDGSYTFTGLSTGTYRLEPILEGYSFEPASAIVMVPHDATEYDFSALDTTPPNVPSPTPTPTSTLIEPPPLQSTTPMGSQAAPSSSLDSISFPRLPSASPSME